MNSNELFDCSVKAVESIFKSKEQCGAVVQNGEYDDEAHRTFLITNHGYKCIVACYNNIEQDTVQVNIHLYTDKKDTLACSVCEAAYNGSYFSFTSNTRVSTTIEKYTAAHKIITDVVTHIDDTIRRYIKSMEERNDSDS